MGWLIHTKDARTPLPDHFGECGLLYHDEVSGKTFESQNIGMTVMWIHVSEARASDLRVRHMSKL